MPLEEIDYGILAKRLNEAKKPYIPFGMGEINYTPEICGEMAYKLAAFCANHNIKIIDVNEIPKMLEELIDGTVKKWVYFPINVKMNKLNMEILTYLQNNELVRKTLLGKK